MPSCCERRPAGDQSAHAEGYYQFSSPWGTPPVSRRSSSVSVYRAIGFAFLWQLAVLPALMWIVWDTPSPRTFALIAAVFVVAPLLAGFVHRSWRVGLAAFLLPVFAFAVMFAVFMLIMPTGKW